MALAADGFVVCAESGDGAAAVDAALKERPDLCLIDVSLPGGGGIRAAGEISQQLPSTAIVMLAASLDEDELFAALGAGADGYLLKDIDPARLPFTLQRVLEGEAALPRALTTRIIEEFRRRDGRRRLLLGRQHGVQLTAREWEVLEALEARLSTAAIADRLSVSPVTVRRHVSEILRKLRVPDREAAVRVMESRRRAPSRVQSDLSA